MRTAGTAERSGEDWRVRARCSGAEAEAFFAPGHSEVKEEKAAREAVAVALCQACPVREPCLDYALAERVPHGIWGGRTELQRALLRRHRASATAGVGAAGAVDRSRARTEGRTAGA